MDPSVGEVNLHTVDVVYLLAGIECLHLLEDGIHVGVGRQVDAVLGNEIGRIGGPQFAGLHATLGQIGEDEGDAHQRVASVMCSRIDYSAITFAADDGTRLLHLRHHVHLAHGSGVVLLTVPARHVAQGAGGTQVAHGVARGVLQDIVGHGDQCILLAVHRAVLAEEGQTVHVGVHHEGDVLSALLHQCLDVGEVLLQRLGIVLEVARRLGEQSGDVLHAQLFEQLGQDDAAHAVYGIEGHVEVGLANSLHVHEVEAQYEVDMLLVVGVILAIGTQVVHIGIREILCLGNAQHLVALLGVQELALLVEQLQCVPLSRVVTGGDDDASGSALHGDGYFGGRRRGQADVHHIESHAHERAAHHVLDHLARDACIAAHDNPVAVVLGHTANQCGISRGELHNVQWVQCVTRTSADGSADAGDRFNQCHTFSFLHFTNSWAKLRINECNAKENGENFFFAYSAKNL